MLSNSNPSFLPPVNDNEFLPPIGRWIIFGGIFILTTVGLAFPLASVAKYKETVKAQASLRPAGKLRIVQAATEGQILDILVKENQTVKQGDLIATIEDSRLQTKKNQLENNLRQAQEQLVQTNAQITALNSQIQAEENLIQRAITSAKIELERRRREHQDKQITTTAEVEEALAEVKMANRDLQKAKAELESTQAKLRSLQASYLSAQSRYERYQTVADQGALSLDQLEEAKLEVQQQSEAIAAQEATIVMQEETIKQHQENVVAARARLKRVQAYLDPSRAEIAIAESNIAQEQASGQATLATLNKEREVLIQQRIEINKQLENDRQELQQLDSELAQTKIKATVDGIISQLSLRNSSQTVHLGEKIAQIVPSNASLEVKAQVSPKDIGKLANGQDVQMRVSACPYPDYGTLKGQVQAISSDVILPNTNGALAPTNGTIDGAQGAFYEVTIEPENLVLGQDDNQCTLHLGMEGRADIITREETVMNFLLRKARIITDF
ncbi:multidrug resistance efflux pump [Xenococcus sp. PCC 7305]|uniref:HlyD family efflux transporter periplasmic adaptor subunit n=1 Tax=Xenococcus sp. PCC 7305 TaxID=102125 RepID=UPI0002ABA834|nr:HlyD family efflux transporter periplasmic adaptor subunit [Xenococcus sp. PCC 7305]ELS03278.1 multidrug resistance efflux pump [Xenococcus sp. PCC 7305]